MTWAQAVRGFQLELVSDYSTIGGDSDCITQAASGATWLNDYSQYTDGPALGSPSDFDGDRADDQITRRPLHRLVLPCRNGRAVVWLRSLFPIIPKLG